MQDLNDLFFYEQISHMQLHFFLISTGFLISTTQVGPAISLNILTTANSTQLTFCKFWPRVVPIYILWYNMYQASITTDISIGQNKRS